MATAGCLLTALAAGMMTAPPADAATDVRVEYHNGDWSVTFIGTVRANGVTGYTFEGEILSHCPPGRAPAPKIALGYGASKKGWQYKTEPCEYVSAWVSGEGSRDAGDTVDFLVGANSGLFGIWQYGSKKTFSI